MMFLLMYVVMELKLDIRVREESPRGCVRILYCKIAVIMLAGLVRREIGGLVILDRKHMGFTIRLRYTV